MASQLPTIVLPSQPTSFIGRESEIAEILFLLADPACQLLTLIGLGGIGKTRLAIEVAFQARETFPDGVYFVPLQPLQSPDQVIQAILNALNLKAIENPHADLLAYLQDRQLLLLMDNFEHLLEGAPLLADMLNAAPNVKILVTSRESLRLQEEWLRQIHGLNYPAEVKETAIKNYSAAQLFIERGRRLRGDLDFNAQSNQIIRICQLVDGMPLALELAVGWVRVLSCEEIADEIERSLDILNTPTRNVEPRHRAMRAMLEHSWDLLTDAQQAVFMRLSVFRGGFRKKAVQVIAGASLATLSALVDKSLLKMDTDGRYELHELLRMYGEEQLNRAGYIESQRDAHAVYYADFIYQRENIMKGYRQVKALDEIEADFDNVRVAWSWACQRKYSLLVNRAAEGMRLFCDIRSRFYDGEDLFRPAQESFASEQRTWGRIASRRAWLIRFLHILPNEALITQANQSLAIARKHEDRQETAFCLYLLGLYTVASGSYEAAHEWLRESLDLYRALEDDYFICDVLMWLGYSPFPLSTSLQAELKQNIRYLEESLEYSQRAGAVNLSAWALYLLGSASYQTGQARKGAAYASRSLAIQQACKEQFGVLANNELLACITFAIGDFEESRRLAQKTLQLSLEGNVLKTRKTATALLGLQSAVIDEDYPSAQQLCEKALALPGAFRDFEALHMAHTGLSIIHCAAGDFQAARQHFQTLLRLYLPDRQLFAETVSCFAVLGIILFHEGQPEQAVQLLGLAFTRSGDVGGWLSQWQLLTHLRSQLEAELGEKVYAATWEQGISLDLSHLTHQLLSEFESDVKDHIAAVNWSLPNPLTPRELEVLALLAQNLTNPQIAERLFITTGTVKGHVNRILQKLDATGRQQAVTQAKALHLLKT